MKSMRSKKVWLTTFLAAAFTLFGVGIATVDSVDASADNTVTAESVGLVMDKGAGVRLGTADGNNGIRFVLTMDKTEYSSLMEKVGTDDEDIYSEISFGMIITKASYVTDVKELTVENVFGNEAVFEWKPEGAGGDWTVSEGKSLVVNQTFGYLGTAEDYENDYVGFASLVNLHDYNLTQEFVGRGYMKYVAKDGTVSYRMANYYEDTRANNVRSMVYVAQKAAEDPEMSAYVSALNTLYINHSAVQAQTVAVTVNHHKVDVHGEEIDVETEILSGQKIGATANATALIDEAWIYNETKSTASSVVYANGKTVLDLYYDQDPNKVYDAYHVGGTNPVEKTIKLDEVVTGGIKGEQVEVELALDLLEGTMPGIKVWLFVSDLNAANAQITSPSSTYLPVADYYDEETGTYKFRVTFAWASPSWDIGNVRIALEGGSYRLGVDVVSVKVLSDYDFTISRASTTSYTLPEAVTGAVRYDKAVVTLAFDEVIGDLTQVRLELLNKSGATIANNNEKYYTLADCATGEENTYAMTISFPWGSGDWDVNAIKLITDSANYVAGVNVKSIEIVPVEYDVKFTANAAHEQQNYTLASPMKAMKGDTIEILFTMTNFYGTTNGASTDIYFYLNDALGNVALTPGWLELTDILVEGSTYKVTVNVNATVEIYSIKTQVRYAQKSGLTFDSITLDTVDYDFKLDNETTTAYTLPEAVSGMAQYGVADVTLQLVELLGDLTQVKVELLNANGDVIADNGGEYYTLADCATGTANEYTFKMIAFAELTDYDITAVRLTVDGETYVVGGYFVEITTNAKDYDFVINKTNDYTYVLPDAVTGAVRYDTAVITVELTELIGDLTKLHLQIVNNDGTTVVSNNGNKYFTLADCATGEANVYAFAMTFPWANGNWDVTKVIFTVGDTAHVVGFNVKSIEIVPVEYDLKFTTNKAHEAQTYTLASPMKAMKGDTIEILFTMTNFYGTTNGPSTDIYFYLNDALGNVALTPGWLELTDILVEGNQYKVIVNATATVEIYSIKTQVRYAQKSGLTFDSITLDTVDYDFKLDNETTTAYTLPEAVSGMAQYGVADVTLQLVELLGDLTQVKVELLNAGGEVIADNSGEYYELADCATGEANEYTFKMVSLVELTDYDVASIRITVDGSSYAVGGYFVDITTSAKDYDFVINKASYYTYTLSEAVTGAVRYDTMLVTVELSELVGDLTKLHLQLKNTAGTVVANNSDKYFTLADCVTGEENVYAFALSFPWANGNWDISQIIFTVGDTAHVVGFKVKAVEVQEVAYQLEYDFASGSQKKVHTFDKVAGGTQYGYVKVTFDVAVFYGTLTNIQFNLCTDTAGTTTVANSNKAWAEDGTKITSSGGQISMSNLTGKKTVTIVTTFPWANGNWDLQSISLQLYGTNLQAGVSNIQVELMPDFVPAA